MKGCRGIGLLLGTTKNHKLNQSSSNQTFLDERLKSRQANLAVDFSDNVRTFTDKREALKLMFLLVPVTNFTLRVQSLQLKTRKPVLCFVTLGPAKLFGRYFLFPSS